MMKSLALLALGLAPFTLAPAASAQSDDGWNWEIAPMYLWAMGLDGTMTVMGQSNEVDMSFGDLMDDLDFVATVHFEGNNGSLGFFTDLTFVDLAPEVPLPMGGVGEAGIGITMLEAAGIYRMERDNATFDLIFGLRSMDLDVDIVLPAPPPEPATSTIEIEGNQDWLDGMIGGRMIKPLSPKFKMLARADIASGGSDFTWNVSLLFDYSFTPRWSLGFGYRYMDIDYEDGAGEELFRFDAALSGPLLGVVYAF